MRIKTQRLTFIIRSEQRFLIRGPGTYLFRRRPSLTTNNNMITIHIHNRTAGARNIDNHMKRGSIITLASFAHRFCP